MDQDLINIIKRQKIQKESFLKSKFISRDQLKEKEELLKLGLIKIIIGPRRAGKSVFLLLLLQGIDFMYANFDDDDLVKNIDNKNDFTDALEQVYGKVNTILFDEIQNLPNWDLYLNKLQREGYNVFITGSNSNLLSTEFASSLTGRYRTLEILPFSFLEYMKAINGTGNFDYFLKHGSFPELIIKNLDLMPYIDDLISAILYKDVTRRFLIKDPEKINLMIIYLISNCCNILNYVNLGKACDMSSFRTMKRYLGYIQNCYLFYFLSGFSFKTSNHLKSSKKIYVVDNGILSYKNLFHSPNNGLFFENLVFTELIKRGYNPNSYLFYYKTKNNYEIDFVIKDIYKVGQLIQVCFDISSKKTEEREIKALIQASDELKCDNLLIITVDTDKIEKVGDKTIKFISFTEWAKSFDKNNKL